MSDLSRLQQTIEAAREGFEAVREAMSNQGQQTMQAEDSAADRIRRAASALETAMREEEQRCRLLREQLDKSVKAALAMKAAVNELLKGL